MGMRAQFVIPVLASILVLGTLGLSQEAYATTFTIEDAPDGGDCVVLGGTWVGSTCTIDDLTINSGDTLIITNGARVIVEENLTNHGTILIEASDIQLTSLEVSGDVFNDGLVEINGDFGESLFGGIRGDSNFINAGIIRANSGDKLALITVMDENFINDCSGLIEINGGSADGISFDIIQSFFFSDTAINRGTIILNGGEGALSGSMSHSGFIPFVNQGSIFSNPGSGINSGLFLASGIIEEPYQCALDKLNELISEIEGLDLAKPSEKSLTQKLNAAIKFLTDKNEKNDLNSCNKLDDFVNQVNAQEGKGLTTPQADSLRESADSIKTSIGCGPPGCPNPSHLGFVFEGEITSISDPFNLLGGIIAEGETWSTFYCLAPNTPDTNPNANGQYEIDFIAITIGDNDEFVCTDAQIVGIGNLPTSDNYQVFCLGMTPPVLPEFTTSLFNISLVTTNTDLLDDSLPTFAPDLNDFDVNALLIWNIDDFSFGSQVIGTITSFVQVQ